MEARKNNQFSKKAQLIVAMAIIVLTTCANADLFAHWSMDETEGSIIYDSAGANHGVLYGPQRVSGVFGNAIWLDGSNDYASLPDNEPIWLLQNDFTLALWVKSDRDPIGSPEVWLDMNFAGSGDPDNELGYQLGRAGTGLIGFGVTTTSNPDEDMFSNTILQKNLWYHIIAIRNGSTQAIYINGVLDNLRTMSIGPIDFVGGYDDNLVNIGRTTRVGLPPADQAFFRGTIDDVRIYDHALSQEEITALVPEPATLLMVLLGGILLRKRTKTI